MQYTYNILDEAFPATPSENILARDKTVEVTITKDDGTIETKRYGYLSPEEKQKIYDELWEIQERLQKGEDLEKVVEGKVINLNGCFVKDFSLDELRKQKDFATGYTLLFPIIQTVSAYFEGYTDFRKSQFHIDTSFREARFHSYADFREVLFYNYTDFSKTQFYGLTLFYSAQFHGYSDFSKVEVHGQADFREVQFHKETSFSSAQFHDDAYFSSAQFNNDANFTISQFHNYTDFSAAQFHNYTDFSAVQFYGNVTFTEVQFNQTKIQGHTHFLGTHFHGDADFSAAHFHGYALFHKVQFDANMNFEAARFGFTYRRGITDFTSILCKGSTNFVSAEFYNTARFNSAVFSELVEFKSAVFEDGVFFQAANFEKGFLADDMRKCKEWYFQQTMVKGISSFDNARIESLQLLRSSFQQPVSFTKCHITNADFTGTVFSTYAVFKAAHIGGNSRETFRIIKNELLKTNNRLDSIEYQKKEMEAYREELRTLRRTKNTEHGNPRWDLVILFFNRISNNYGTDWRRAVWFTVGIALLLYLPFSLFGLNENWNQYGSWWCGWFLQPDIPWQGLSNGFVKFLYTATPTDLIEYAANNCKDGMYKTHLAPLGYTLFLLSRLAIAYGLFQIVQAFRKYKLGGE